MSSKTYSPLAKSDADKLNQMYRWMRNFRITGDGVTFKNAGDACVASIQWPPDKFQPRQKAAETALVAILGTAQTYTGTSPTGGGEYYNGTELTGTSNAGVGSGTTPGTNNFQLEAYPVQSATDGPKWQVDGSGHPVNNCLICNLGGGMGVNNTNVLWASVTPRYYTIGKVMGYTAETTPRKIVYIDNWATKACIAKITGRITSDYGGTYYGRIVNGLFASGSTLGSAFPLSTVSSSALPNIDNCWITNNWEQTYGGVRWSIPTNTFVWGIMAGFPLYSVSGGSTSNNTWMQVYTWFPPQSATLAHPIQALSTTQSAGTTYTTNEQAMLNALKTDVTNIRASLSDLYSNLQQAGYSL